MLIRLPLKHIRLALKINNRKSCLLTFAERLLSARLCTGHLALAIKSSQRAQVWAGPSCLITPEFTASAERPGPTHLRIYPKRSPCPSPQHRPGTGAPVSETPWPGESDLSPVLSQLPVWAWETWISLGHHPLLCSQGVLLSTSPAGCLGSFLSFLPWSSVWLEKE